MFSSRTIRLVSYKRENFEEILFFSYRGNNSDGYSIGTTREKVLKSSLLGVYLKWEYFSGKSNRATRKQNLLKKLKRE
jgi:hypothetical protein